MPHLLQNKNIEATIDLPLENYQNARFDWSGKISLVKFKGYPITALEDINSDKPNTLGRGLYNEFGIDKALGFEETKLGDWFHKIGIGLLKKESNHYMFSHSYEIKPATFTYQLEPNRITINCESDLTNGFQYNLSKEISLQEDGITIAYQIKNLGSKTIDTDEYTHNFLGISQDKYGIANVLQFPFELQESKFKEVVNPEKAIRFYKNKVLFNQTPKEQFFFSPLNTAMSLQAKWELIHQKNQIGIRETGDFIPSKINLWGSQQVISPELFHQVQVLPKNKLSWKRQYQFFELE